MYTAQDCNLYGRDINITIETYKVPYTDGWTITDKMGVVQLSGGPYQQSFFNYSYINTCVYDGIYTFEYTGTRQIRMIIEADGEIFADNIFEKMDTRTFQVKLASSGPSQLPTFLSTGTALPSIYYAPKPTAPTKEETPVPPPIPSAIPTYFPSSETTNAPTASPSYSPTSELSNAFTASPTYSSTSEPTNAFTASLDSCPAGFAKETERARECGARGGPAQCCPGLVCHDYQTWKCAKPENKQCSGHLTYATECGSTSWSASPKCCPGLTCLGKKCVKPTALCAPENKRSKYCEAKGGEDVCCPELVCHAYQTWRCVTEDKKECADIGTKAKECGSNYLSASPVCCPGLVCDVDTKTCASSSS